MERTPLRISNAFDIWSICCLFVDTVAWTLYGPAEITRFSNARKEETVKDINYAPDCFHNGRAELTIVKTYLQDYKKECESRGDFAGVKVIDMSAGILAIPK